MIRKGVVFLLLALPALVLSLPGQPGPTSAARAAVAPAPAGRTVYLAGGLSDDDLTVLSVAVAADPSAVLLIDDPKASTHNKDFLAAFAPTEVVPIGKF